MQPLPTSHPLHWRRGTLEITTGADLGTAPLAANTAADLIFFWQQHSHHQLHNQYHKRGRNT